MLLLVLRQPLKSQAKTSAQILVGTGPFVFAGWEKDSKITLTANKDYWDGKPKVDKLIFEVVKENSVRANKLMAGEADIIDGIDPNDVERLKGDAKLNFSTSPGYEY